jgi:hypothetical protein
VILLVHALVGTFVSVTEFPAWAFQCEIIICCV